MAAPRALKGFTLIEMLVAIVVLSTLPWRRAARRLGLTVKPGGTPRSIRAPRVISPLMPEKQSK